MDTLTLEATFLSQLPQDVLNVIWEIYSKWRNIKLWTDRYQGFLYKIQLINSRNDVCKVDKSTINIISDTVKYIVPDEVRGFNNYHDTLLLKCTADIEQYRRICGRCHMISVILDVECNKCGFVYCRSCIFHGHIPMSKDKHENGVWIIKECPYCKVI